ncbi:MAG TPA: hypothetical protein VNP97_14810 [Microbacterium sp.]|nr:hypothetical protein [Microbacterium sp.]
MSESPQWIERFLAADPHDVGCDEAIAMMHVYAELRAAGVDPEERYPGVVAHLAACESCAEDAQGLLEAILDDGIRIEGPPTAG